MNYLSVENLSKRYGEKLLFESLSFGISKGSKVALIAANGTGKSTLLKIISGLETPDSGEVVFRNDIRVGYLPQEHGMNKELSILDALFKADIPIMNAVRNYELALEKDANTDEFNRASTEMDRLNAWDHETKARQILGILDIHQLERKIGELSGGQQRRVALAKTLLEEPDFLILDEPTNHLDLDMIEWMENYLIRTNMTLFMVTHDRYYLEGVVDEILELEQGQMYKYKGNFSYYLEKKAERETQEAASMEKAKNLMRKELEWVRSSPKARTTKSKSRLDRFDDIKEAARGKKNEQNIKAEINMERLGGKILELHKISKSFRDLKIIERFDYVFNRAERMGVVGKNGSGKSTFLKILTGELEVDSGKVVKGETVLFGHYSQQGLKFKSGQRVIEAIRDIAEVIPLKGGQKLTAAELLERFMFPRKRHFEHISKLSGGEKKRLHLCTVLMKNPNFLILDEPTNDLDIFTLSTLEDYLLQFNGCLIIVSHDRYFMDKLVDHVLWFKGDGEIKDIPGNYSIYKEYLDRERAGEKREKKEAAPKEGNSTSPEKKSKKKLGFKEKYELEQLEKEMPKLEKRKTELETKISAGSSDHEELMTWSTELGEISEALDEKEMRWLELSELD